MDEVWCSLDMAADIAGLHGALADPFWPAFSDCAASFIANDDVNACFGVADVDLMASTNKVEDMVDMDAAGVFLGGEDNHLILQHDPMLSSSSSPSSKRSLSIDSGGSSASFKLDAALAAAAATNVVSQYPAPVALHPFAGGDHDDAAIMRAMMAVISSSSASPSSSASGSAYSPGPFSREDSMQQAAVPQPRGGNGQVMVKSSLAKPPEKMLSIADGGGGHQQEGPRTASSNSSQLYHMMSERKRREKLNDSFQTLRSLLPPCSKKDKTMVLMNAASYLKTLEAQISELEEKNTKLERHIPCEDGGRSSGAMRGARAHQRAKVQISKASSSDQQGSELVNLTVMVMVECDIVDLVLHILDRLRWMKEISVLSVDADTYSPQVLLKAIASIKLQIMDGDWNEASFHEAMTKAVNDATSSSSCAPLVLTARR